MINHKLFSSHRPHKVSNVDNTGTAWQDLIAYLDGVPSNKLLLGVACIRNSLAILSQKVEHHRVLRHDDTGTSQHSSDFKFRGVFFGSFPSDNRAW